MAPTAEAVFLHAHAAIAVAISRESDIPAGSRLIGPHHRRSKTALRAVRVDNGQPSVAACCCDGWGFNKKKIFCRCEFSSFVVRFRDCWR